MGNSDKYLMRKKRENYLILSYDPKGKKADQYWNGSEWTQNRLDIRFYTMAEASRVLMWIIDNIDYSYKREEIDITHKNDLLKEKQR
jgi:hypothetical protein